MYVKAKTSFTDLNILISASEWFVESFIFSTFGSGCGRRIILRIDSSPCD